MGVEGDGGAPAEAQRGRTEEAAGASKAEVGEEGEAHRHFFPTSWRGKHKQTVAGQLTGSGRDVREK